MRKICKNADFVIKSVRRVQSPSAYLQLTFESVQELIFESVQEHSQFNLWYFAGRPLSSRLCGRRCKKGLLNPHSQRPFLTQSVASCHITLPSCPPLLCTAAMRFSQTKLCSILTSNYCSVLLQIAREMPIRPALMASVSNQSTEDRVGPHMVETATWPRSGALADKVQDRGGGESEFSVSKEGPSIGVSQNSIENVLTTY